MTRMIDVSLSLVGWMWSFLLSKQGKLQSTMTPMILTDIDIDLVLCYMYKNASRSQYSSNNIDSHDSKTSTTDDATQSKSWVISLCGWKYDKETILGRNVGGWNRTQIRYCMVCKSTWDRGWRLGTSTTLAWCKCTSTVAYLVYSFLSFSQIIYFLQRNVTCNCSSAFYSLVYGLINQCKHKHHLQSSNCEQEPHPSLPLGIHCRRTCSSIR